MPDYDFFSDEQLVQAARDGEEKAWESLMRRHGQRLLAFFSRMNGGALAPAKELWVSLWNDLASRRPSLASGPRFSTVAFGLALKLSLAHEQAAPKRPLGRIRADPASLEGRSARLHLSLAELPASERAAVCLGYFDSLSWEELGRVLGCRAADACALCAAGYAQLDKILGPDFLTAGL